MQISALFALSSLLTVTPAFAQTALSDQALIGILKTSLAAVYSDDSSPNITADTNLSSDLTLSSSLMPDVFLNYETAVENRIGYSCFPYLGYVIDDRVSGILEKTKKWCRL